MIKHVILALLISFFSTNAIADKYEVLNTFLQERAQGRKTDPNQIRTYQGISNAQNEISYIQNNHEKNCFKTAGDRYQIDPWLLFTISLVESSFNPQAKAPVRANGQRAMGLMQFDSTWIPIFKKRYKVTLTESDFLDGCKSVMLGAWVLADNFYRLGYTWKAIGLYNAKNERAQKIYAHQIYKMYDLVMKHEETGEIYKNPKAPLKEYFIWWKDFQKNHINKSA